VIYGFPVILRINSYYFPQQHQSSDLYDGPLLFFVVTTTFFNTVCITFGFKGLSSPSGRSIGECSVTPRVKLDTKKKICGQPHVPVALTPKKELRYTLDMGLSGPTAGLDVVEKRKGLY
jgi:hypothetical protein